MTSPRISFKSARCNETSFEGLKLCLTTLAQGQSAGTYG